MKYLLYSLLFILAGYNYANNSGKASSHFPLEQEKIVNHVTTGMDKNTVIDILGQPNYINNYTNQTQCFIYTLSNKQHFYLIFSHHLLILYSNQQTCSQLVEKIDLSFL